MIADICGDLLVEFLIHKIGLINSCIFIAFICMVLYFIDKHFKK